MAIHQTFLAERKRIADDTIEVSFRRPAGFSFKAGQHVQVGVPELLHADPRCASRIFSIASSPCDRRRISIAFRDTGSGFKRTLMELPVGAPISIEGPHGFFAFPERPARPIVCIAGGIGITPFMSMIRHADELGTRFPLLLLYANRSRDSAAYLEELRSMASRSTAFTLKTRFGKMDEQFLRQNVKEMQESAWYIAGPAAMVGLARNTLFLSGVNTGRIYYEEFAGY